MHGYIQEIYMFTTHTLNRNARLICLSSGSRGGDVEHSCEKCLSLSWRWRENYDKIRKCICSSFIKLFWALNRFIKNIYKVMRWVSRTQTSDTALGLVCPCVYYFGVSGHQTLKLASSLLMRLCGAMDDALDFYLKAVIQSFSRVDI